MLSKKHKEYLPLERASSLFRLRAGVYTKEDLSGENPDRFSLLLKDAISVTTAEVMSYKDSPTFEGFLIINDIGIL